MLRRVRSSCLPRAAAALVAALLLSACDRGPIEWNGAVTREEPRADSSSFYRLGSAGDLEVEARGTVQLTEYETGGCRGSLRLSTARDRHGRTLTAAVWWAVRPDSSARLVSAMSADQGRTWSPAVPVDSLDRSGRGCARPAPAVAFEPRTGYVHVAYFLDAPEGPGVFFAHSMDEGQLFHSPVPIVYGERPVDVGIAAAGDTVAVVYEDPNARQPTIGLALSRSQGHLFERKALTAAPREARASEPRVWVGGRDIKVAWVERGQDGRPAFVVRHGRVKDGALEGD